jgi:hypothetical protein
MANPDSVSQYYLDAFGQARIGIAAGVTLNTTGNAVVSIPFLVGGLTKGAATANSGGVIIRRITVMNPSGSIASANVNITTTNDGNVSNAVVANVTLSGISGVGTFTDLTIAGGNVLVSGATTSALYVNINTASGNSNTVDIRVYGDVVTF